jgi:hypothetical protein
VLESGHIDNQLIVIEGDVVEGGDASLIGGCGLTVAGESVRERRYRAHNHVCGRIGNSNSDCANLNLSQCSARRE